MKNVNEPSGKIRTHLENLIRKGINATSDKDKQQFRRDVLDVDVIPNLEGLLKKFVMLSKCKDVAVLHDSDPIALLEVCCAKSMTKCTPAFESHLSQYT